jgi:hypothetical protein
MIRYYKQLRIPGQIFVDYIELLYLLNSKAELWLVANFDQLSPSNQLIYNKNGEKMVPG